MNNVVIRTAKADYVCEKCGHLIHKGAEYLDHCIFNMGNVVRHERYHDECPLPNKLADLLRLLADHKGEVLCWLKHNAKHEDLKIVIVGVVYVKEAAHIVFHLWQSDKRLLMPLELYTNNVYNEYGVLVSTNGLQPSGDEF